MKGLLQSGSMILSFLLFVIANQAASQEPASIDPSTSPETEEAEGVEATSQPPADETQSQNFGSNSLAAATRRDTEPPGYAHPINEGVLPGPEDWDWFVFGLEQRTRFEMRDDNYRRGLLDDERFMLRTRAFFGIQRILDPLRFGFEFQDSRQFGTELPELTRDANEADILQAYAELYFADGLGRRRPIRFQAGRIAFDAIDRRLVSRNRFRNTTNAFDGFRIQFGQPHNDWQVDFFAMQPVERFVRARDHGDDERWFYGLLGAWRGWMPHVTLEPYWFILDEDRKSHTTADREVHTMGLHGFGLIGKTGFDYDFDVAFQYGENGDRDIRAFASHGEVGYTISHDWKPRLAVSVDYASGDRTPDDSLDERFDSLFGSSKTMYSYMNLFPRSNLIQPSLWIQFRPTAKMRVNAIYRANWLASDSDAFIRAGLRDPTGQSGDFVGQEVDLEVQYTFTEWLSMDVGYAHFFPGSFTSRVGGEAIDDADYFYCQMVLKF